MALCSGVFGPNTALKKSEPRSWNEVGGKCALHHVRPCILLSSYHIDSLTIRDFHDIDHRIIVNAKVLIAAIEPDIQEDPRERKIVKFKNQRVLYKIAHTDFCNYTAREWSEMKRDIGR